MKFTDIVKLKTLIVMFKQVQIILIIIYKNVLFLVENIHLSGKNKK